MIEQLRLQLWEAMYLNPVWPHELLENIKDPSYKQVNIKPIDGGSVVELTFVDDGELCNAFYTFDSDDHLQQATIVEGQEETIIYDRSQLISSTLDKINQLIKVENLQMVTA
ncbi:hypothetical protein A2U94_17980 [Bacillus sp. VT 712]|uniref:hypothetical protein n=1 Tax=Bacillus sp. VT 712 TaxID=1848047 RepID=UPI0007A46F31|nr:hypothetical protein [Bacillus sp. VT 712]KZB90050.1 hypothetical protein A2U94_17980 [Bacillus sp. VT 712]